MKIEKSFKCLGTDINLMLITENESERIRAEKSLEGSQVIFENNHKKFSRFDSESELSSFNSSLEEFRFPSDDFLKLCLSSLEFYEKTNGIFDPRIFETLQKIGYSKDFSQINLSDKNISINTEIFKKELKDDLIIENGKICFRKIMDLTGIAKGFIVDLVKKQLIEEGWKNFLVDAGGDMFVAGKNDSGEKWSIEVEGFPAEKLQIILSDEAIATSGITRKKWRIGEKQFHHLINPKNLKAFCFELKTVSVIAENVIEADAWAKVLFLLGKEKGIDMSEKRGIKSVFLDRKGNVQYSSFFKLNFYQR